MKKLNLTLLTLLLALCTIHGQVREEVRPMAMGTYNAFILPLPDTEEKLAKKVWEDFIKQYGAELKKVKKSEEYLADNALIPAVSESNNPVDVYSRIESTKTDATLTVWVDLGGAYLDGNTFPEKGAEFTKILNRFAIELAREKTKIELENQEKELKKQESQLRKLEKDNTGYHEDIEQAKEKIKKAEANIEQNLRDQEASKQRIEAQKKLLEAIHKKLNDL